jgi:hypothetical protein
MRVNRAGSFLFALAAVMAGPVPSASASASTVVVDVTVKVNLVTSSGPCSGVTGAGVVGVTCPRGGALASGDMFRGLPIGYVPVTDSPAGVYSDGVKVSSWRIVKLDNADYVELTITW